MDREEAFRGIVDAISARPIDSDVVSQARQILKKQGEGTLVEAAVVLGFFEGMTKITDATGKKPMPGFIWTSMRIIFAVIRFIYEKWMAIFRTSWK